MSPKHKCRECSKLLPQFRLYTCILTGAVVTFGLVRFLTFGAPNVCYDQSSHLLTICSSELAFLVLGHLFFEGGYILLYCGTPTFRQRGLSDCPTPCFQNPRESSDDVDIFKPMKIHVSNAVKMK